MFEHINETLKTFLNKTTIFYEINIKFKIVYFQNTMASSEQLQECRLNVSMGHGLDSWLEDTFYSCLSTLDGGEQNTPPKEESNNETLLQETVVKVDQLIYETDLDAPMWIEPAGLRTSGIDSTTPDDSYWNSIDTDNSLHSVFDKTSLITIIENNPERLNSKKSNKDNIKLDRTLHSRSSRRNCSGKSRNKKIIYDYADTLPSHSGRMKNKRENDKVVTTHQKYTGRNTAAQSRNCELHSISGHTFGHIGKHPERSFERIKHTDQYQQINIDAVLNNNISPGRKSQSLAESKTIKKKLGNKIRSMGKFMQRLNCGQIIANNNSFYDR